MNIVLTTPWPLDHRGGVNVIVMTLAKHFRQQGHRVFVMVPKHSGRPEFSKADDIDVVTMSLRLENSPSQGLKSRLANRIYRRLTAKWLDEFIRREKIDVVNTHYMGEYWSHIFDAQRRCGFRLIVSVHGSDVLGTEASQNLNYLREHSSYFDSLIFCSNGFLRETLEQSDPLNAKARIVLNAISNVAISANRASVRSGDIFCIAHLREHKGQDVLLRALKLLLDQGTQARLTFAGDGPFRETLEKLTDELGIRDAVTFLGDIPRSKVMETLAQSEVMCLPSRREPFGLVILEALQSRVPVVATNVGGIPEIVRDGQEALLVQPDDPAALAKALSTVLHDKGLARRLCESGAKRVAETFTVDRFVAEYSSILCTRGPEPKRKEVAG